jgi:hypothetical protein
MVADSHPITHPPKTKTNVCVVTLSAMDHTAAKMAAQTIAQPTL